MLGGCQVKLIGDSWWAVWAARHVNLEFTRTHDSHETLTAEVKVVSEVAGLLHWSRVNLLSLQGRSAIAKALEEALPDETPWRKLVDLSCHDVVQAIRKGDPAKLLERQEPSSARWWVPDWIPSCDTTVIYGDGGSGKSLIALSLATAALEHKHLGYWNPGPATAVLYLDWESDYRDHAERLWQLTGSAVHILHRRMVRPLTDVIGDVRHDVDTHHIDLVICDSLGAACGSEPESADAAIRTLMALRTLKTTTRLVVAHVSKASMDDRHSRPFGSVYVQNLARSTIEARRHEEEDGESDLVVSLYHRKCNYGKLARPWGLRFAWGIDGAITTQAELPDMSRTSVVSRILHATPFEPNSKSVPDIAEEVGTTEGTVRTKLNELQKRTKVIQLGTDTLGRGHKAQWARPLQKRTGDDI